MRHGSVTGPISSQFSSSQLPVRGTAARDVYKRQVLEDHIRLHLVGPKAKALTPELGEELIDVVRAYMK